MDALWEVKRHDSLVCLPLHPFALRRLPLLVRAPAPPGAFVRGKTGYVPFLPGGLDDAFLGSDTTGRIGSAATALRKIPPGFERGLDYHGDSDDRSLLDDISTEAVNEPIDILPLNSSAKPISSEPTNIADWVDELLPSDRSFLAPHLGFETTKNIVEKKDWAHEVDVSKPIKNFREMVPDMARKASGFGCRTIESLPGMTVEAVYHLEMGDSVFVAAHTSAGKTVVAEYAIALAAKHMTRAIYTSPIKALSNQKFRDFKQTFDPSSVGILTGDVQINPEGSCLIMTTEILRSMLYKGADIIRDVEFVIFDEVHYVNDLERGVVWEEVIIMLPEHVSIILLSATVPNTKEFAEWVGRTKRKDIYVISTTKRPVPLEHYLWAGRSMHLVLDARGEFLQKGLTSASDALRRKQDKAREAAGLPPITRGGGPGRGGQSTRGQPARGRGGGGFGPRSFQQQDKNLHVHLVNHLKAQTLLPVVIFTFSKKRCEEHASTLVNLDLCTASEKSEVHVTVEKALSRLHGTDKKLPQISRISELLRRGIGVHHGGLLPIIKEVVEILFAKGLIKVLFATETFAMGVNMPARSVVFSSIRKHDGRGFRDILPGEYTQMSGRAGRRGLDATGVVIIVSGDEAPDAAMLKNMMCGKPTKLTSQFRLTYNMILNLLRVEALRVEEMIKRSFSENASQRLLPEQQKEITRAEGEYGKLPALTCTLCLEDIELYYSLAAEIVAENTRMLNIAPNDRLGSKLLVPGRVVILRDLKFGCKAALIVKLDPTPSERVGNGRAYYMLVSVDQATKERSMDLVGQRLPPRWPLSPQLLLLDDIVDMVGLESRRISVMQAAAVRIQDVCRDWIRQGLIPELDWAKMKKLEFQECLRERNAMAQRLNGRVCTSCPNFESHYDIVHERQLLAQRIQKLRHAVSDQNLELLPEYQQRMAVLEDLRYIDENQTVLLKGRVACEINSANELVLTELILDNAFALYEPEEVVALLSGFIFQEKTEIDPVLPTKLIEGRDHILAIAERVGRVQDGHGVPAPDFQSSLKFGLIEAVYEWAKGMPFEQIMHLTDVPEGTLVRVITRLDETCREVRDAARVIGDMDLFKKIEAAQTKIKRDIVFAASLYF
ncbi:hypothetical protein FRB99_002126 [Tulasnella sp. 403]|nr:hypothetical protein FRB99_002126 [Tulasnella sp. 403]